MHFNKNYFEFDNNINGDPINYNKTYNDYDKEVSLSNATIEDRNNYTDLNRDMNLNKNTNDRKKINSRRSQMLQGMLNCDVKLGSAQIKITDLDKTSLRKNRDSIKNDKEGKIEIFSSKSCLPPN